MQARKHKRVNAAGTRGERKVFPAEFDSVAKRINNLVKGFVQRTNEASTKRRQIKGKGPRCGGSLLKGEKKGGVISVKKKPRTRRGKGCGLKMGSRWGAIGKGSGGWGGHSYCLSRARPQCD